VARYSITEIGCLDFVALSRLAKKSLLFLGGYVIGHVDAVGKRLVFGCSALRGGIRGGYGVCEQKRERGEYGSPP
jgi:hypothetical protein